VKSIRHPRLVQRRDRVAPARDRDEPPLPRQFAPRRAARPRSSPRRRARSRRRRAGRSRSASSPLSNPPMRATVSGPASRIIASAGRRHRQRLGRRPRLELARHDHVDRQVDLAGSPPAAQDIARRLGHLALGQGFADLDPWPQGRCSPSPRRSPDGRPCARGSPEARSWSTPSPRPPPPPPAAPGDPSAASSAFSSASISRPRRRQQPRQPLGRGMRPVRGRKRVVHVDVAQRRHLRAPARVVLLLAGMEARVFQQHHSPGRSGRNRRGRHRPRNPPRSPCGQATPPARRAARCAGSSPARPCPSAGRNAPAARPCRPSPDVLTVGRSCRSAWCR
jgi:hypothetical protein